MRLSSQTELEQRNPEQPHQAAREFRNSTDLEDKALTNLFHALWEGKKTTLASIVIFLSMGAFMIWRATPVYQAEGMLQLQEKRGANNTDPNAAHVEKLFAETLEAQAEIEILNSNLLLGRVVQNLKLDLDASPVLLPVIGAALNRKNPNAPKIVIDSFEVTEGLRGVDFKLTTLDAGRYRLEAEEPPFLGTGEVGKPLKGVVGEDTFTLQVGKLMGKVGQKFKLVKRPIPVTIDALRLDFDAVEKGRLTNVLGLTCKAGSKAKCVAILNEIMNQYVRLKIERRNAEAAKTLAVLQEKMPGLKAKLDEAESNLNRYRSRSGSVDLSHEADMFLQQGNGLAAQISALRQKKEELLRTYTSDADVVVTVDQQLRKLQDEAGQVDAKVRTLPHTEQEVVRLSREAQVDTALYTALLNNIQELQVAAAGNIGNVSIIDLAQANPIPISPRKPLLIALFLFMGTATGIGINMGQKALNPGVEDHRLIEAKLGIPVIATIPHSRAQDKLFEAMRKRQPGMHLLALEHPDDLATESMKSLRTMLQLSLQSDPSRIILVAGPSPSIGKSFITANLAVVLAQAGSRVVVIDADLRRGNLHRYFGVKTRLGGLADVLEGRAKWEAVVHPLIPLPGDPTGAVLDLKMMSTGTLPSHPSELLGSVAFTTLLAELSAAFDFVLIDSPPLLSVTDASILGSRAGTVLLAAKYGQHPLDEYRACLKRLDNHAIRLAGCVFNDVTLVRSSYKYAYHYAYGSKES